ncbi:hypothetical protein DFH07DRAFT_1058586 [Mycena maculata]|uniref:Uncharacterized protein n=1 Tax=Mycena maculata TaxID=230809 RepID=A0AAD7NN06_9AGAR|nr:hypothetical protein DFH07DRAFT_1058586 [Mycena maculata]
MVFNNAKVMHPHKDIYYSTPPVAAANVQNYWVHRQHYLNRGPGPSNHPTSIAVGHHNTSMQSTSPYYTPAGSTIYSSNPSPVQSTSVQGGMSHAAPANVFNQGSYPEAYPSVITPPGGFNNLNQMSPHGNTYPPSSGYHNPHAPTQTMAGFNTLAPHPVVVPAGFTETHPSAPGWWRNPVTGWFWHASHGLSSPSHGRG